VLAQPTNGTVLVALAVGIEIRHAERSSANKKIEILIWRFEKAWMAGSSPAMTCLVHGTVKEGRGCPPSRA
jgi:hypothetical protein